YARFLSHMAKNRTADHSAEITWMLEAVQKKRAHEKFLAEFIPLLERIGTPEAKEAKEAIEGVFERAAGVSPEAAQWYAKHWVVRLSDAAQVALLYDLADHGGERYGRLA